MYPGTVRKPCIGVGLGLVHPLAQRAYYLFNDVHHVFLVPEFLTGQYMALALLFNIYLVGAVDHYLLNVGLLEELGNGPVTAYFVQKVSYYNIPVRLGYVRGIGVYIIHRKVPYFLFQLAAV